MTTTAGLHDRFVGHLTRLRDRGDRPALAALRRVLGHDVGVIPEADRWLVPWIPEEATDRTARAYYLVAALFATHPDGPRPNVDDSSMRRSLAATFARLKDGHNDAAVERRFIAALNAHADDLPDHLRRLVQLLRQGRLGIDWAQLLRDIEQWDHPDRFVQRRWARAFWTGQTVAEPDSVTLTEDA